MKIVEIIKEGDALAGKAFTWIRDGGEHVIVEVETEVGKWLAKVHSSHVKDRPDIQGANTVTSDALLASESVNVEDGLEAKTEAPETAQTTPPENIQAQTPTVEGQ